MNHQLPEEVRKEIQSLGADDLLIATIERIALLAFKAGALAGVRVAKEAAAAMVMDWDDTRRGLNASDTAASILDIPEHPIVEAVCGKDSNVG